MKITLKDGSVKEYSEAKSVYEIEQISVKGLQEWRQQEK